MRWEPVSTILLLVVWQALAMIFPGRLFPTPTAVALELWTDIADGKLMSDMAKTLWRATISFTISMTIGVALGILFGRSRIADRLFSSWVIVGLNLPAVVIAIVLYISLGLNEMAIILAVIINKVPLVVTTIREGVRSFSSDYDELALAFRIPFWRRLRLVFIPQLTPYVLAAARTGLALIWKIVLVFEVLGSSGGVGFRINTMFQFFDMTGILAYTTAFILVVLVVEYWLMRPLEHYILRWRTDRV